MKTRMLALFVLLFTLGCDDAAGPDMKLASSYALISINDQPLPVNAACYNYAVTEGVLTLGPLNRAAYRVTYHDPSANSSFSFDGLGTYRLRGSRLDVNVEGDWSDNFPSTQFQFRFEVRNGGIELLRTGVGAECDGNGTETYVDVNNVLRLH